MRKTKEEKKKDYCLNDPTEIFHPLLESLF